MRKLYFCIPQLLTFDVNGFLGSTNTYDPKTMFGVDRPKMAQSALSLTIDSLQVITVFCF